MESDKSSSHGNGASDSDASIEDSPKNDGDADTIEFLDKEHDIITDPTLKLEEAPSATPIEDLVTNFGGEPCVQGEEEGLEPFDVMKIQVRNYQQRSAQNYHN